MFDIFFNAPLIVAALTVSVDFIFHWLFTRPMETLTYFLVKFLLAFFIAAGFFSWRYAKNKPTKKAALSILAALIFSTLMSAYYRAWELFEAYAPFGSRAPDILGVDRLNLLLFSGSWWLAHALFFAVGLGVAINFLRKNENKNLTR